MVDVSKTIAAKSDQLNAIDLLDAPRTVTITNVSSAVGDQPISINFEGDDGKPWKPCKSMRRVLVKIWGKDGALYIGRQVTLYNDPNVTWAGEKVGGIRISHMSHMEQPEVSMSLTVSRKSKKPFKVKRLEGIAAPVQAAEADPDVVAAGDAAAAQGVDAYIKWRDALDPDVKETIKPRNGAWSKIAKDFDTSQAVEEEEEIPI